MNNIKTGKQFIAAAMTTIEKGLPLLSMGRTDGLFNCTLKYNKKAKTWSLVSEDEKFNIPIDSNSDFYKFVKKHRGHIYVDNIYYRKTDKIKKFIKLIAGMAYDGGYDDDKLDKFTEYYRMLDRDNSRAVVSGDDSYIVVDTYETTSEPYYIGDGEYMSNESYGQQVFNMQGKHVWSPFLDITDHDELDFGGPWF